MSAFLADLILILHLLFILFVVFGGLVNLLYARAYLLHLPCAIYGAAIEFFGWVCPLTYLENDFRQQATATGYDGSFIQHYLLPVIYPGNLTVGLQILLGSSVILINLVIYAIVINMYKKDKSA